MNAFNNLSLLPLTLQCPTENKETFGIHLRVVGDWTGGFLHTQIKDTHADTWLDSTHSNTLIKGVKNIPSPIKVDRKWFYCILSCGENAVP